MITSRGGERPATRRIWSTGGNEPKTFTTAEMAKLFVGRPGFFATRFRIDSQGLSIGMRARSFGYVITERVTVEVPPESGIRK
jgi:hypothetical protein